MKPNAINAVAGFLSAALLAGGIMLHANPLHAQETAGEETAAGLTLAEVEAGLAAVEADAGIEDTLKDQLRPKYTQATEALNEAAMFAARAADYREAIQTAPVTGAELRARLEALSSTGDAASVQPPESTGDLQKAIDLQRAALNDLNGELATTASEQARVKGRPFEISARLPEAQRELSVIRRQLASPALTADETSPTRVADRILLRARQSQLLSESEMLEQEQLSQSAREDLLRVKLELLEARVASAGASLGTLEALLQQRLMSEAQRVGVLADMMPGDMPEDDATAQALAAEVQVLAKEFETVVRNLNRVKAAQEDLLSRLERLTGRYDSVREELQVSAGGIGMAQVLLDMQRRFPEQRAAVLRLLSQLPPLDEMRLAELRVRTKLRSQPEVERQFSGHPLAAVATLVTTRRNILEQLRTQYGTLTRAQAALETDKRGYLDKAEEVRAYAAQQLFGFGTRSAPPISIKTVTGVPESLWWFFQRKHWVELRGALQEVADRLPVLSIGALLAVVVLLLTRRRMVAALEQTGVSARRVSRDRFAHTVEALLWTILLALPVPLLVGVTAWGLEQIPQTSNWLRGIHYGLQLVVWIVLILAFLGAVCRPGGLGAAHFRWQEKPLTRFRRSVRRFGVVYIPALLITFSGLYAEAPQHFLGMGRISFMLATAWMAIVLWQLLNFSDGVLAAFMREQPGSLIARWRFLWFPLVLLFPLMLVVIAGLGYMFTAIQLSIGFLGSAAFITAGVILYQLARRWFRIKQRRLALAEALEKRRARQEAAISEVPQESGDLIAIDTEAEQKLDLVTITEQTAYLLRLFFSLGVAVVILLAWSEQFPVISTLDSIPVPLAGGLTLLGLVKAVLIVVVTYIAARNLPGLLELAVLRATAIDPGTRHAISTLSQYVVIAIGISLLFNVLSVDWAKLGWIAAALSVGIGFGLQEVVANFVCGLILLFERPIRVGDVVTVSNVTGTVTKIQIRATTITNGDRQAFVVPNKSLITGSLLNWTLNAAVNRITIRLGVTGGTDTEQARQILLDVAAAHPLVLDEPAPMANFEEFGPGSLNLVLFAYLANLGDRASTTTEMHTEILRRFATAGIELASPKMDIRIHGDTGIDPGTSPDDRQQEGASG